MDGTETFRTGARNNKPSTASNVCADSETGAGRLLR